MLDIDVAPLDQCLQHLRDFCPVSVGPQQGLVPSILLRIVHQGKEAFKVHLGHCWCRWKGLDVFAIQLQQVLWVRQSVLPAIVESDDMRWSGTVRCGVVRCRLRAVWLGMVWHGTIWHGMVLHGMAQHSTR